MADALPGIISSTQSYRRHRISDHPYVKGGVGVLDAGNTDAGSTPATRFRPGNVVALRTSTGRFVAANDANGDRNTAASVTSDEKPDADWQSKTLTVTSSEGDVVVVLGGADDTIAEVVTAVNAAAAALNIPIVAADSGAADLLVLSTTRKGAGTWIKVTSDLATAFGAAGKEDSGSDADYRVTEEHADLIDENGTAVHARCATSRAGHYDKSELINLTGEALDVLSRRGSVFES